METNITFQNSTKLIILPLEKMLAFYQTIFHTKDTIILKTYKLSMNSFGSPKRTSINFRRAVYKCLQAYIRSGSRTAATSKMECFVIIVNDWKPLTIITKHSILDVAAVLDPPLYI